jgi:hypothetical protein
LFTNSTRNGSRNHFLLVPKVIIDQLAAGDVASIDAWYRMIHEKVDIELSDARGLCDRAVCLPQVIAPLRQRPAILLVLDEVPTVAVGWK